MYKNILQKILTELGKEEPSLDYIKGMVETLMEVNNTTNEPTQFVSKLQTTSPQSTAPSDEEQIPGFLRVK